VFPPRSEEAVIDNRTTPAPKVFISHSSADKDRFVIEFATRLRSAGIEAWVDLWEMLPGDSVIDKIWNEGLKGCDAFIIVLSVISIQSKWVQEELNTGFVKKIEDQTRLIPIRLDSCEVPEALRTVIWVDIHDPANYEREFERIINAIHGQYAKPPLGPKPPYSGRHEVLAMEGLTRIDSIIFEYACGIAIEQGHPDSIDGARLVTDLGEKGISEAQIVETEEVLERRGYIEIDRVIGPPHAYDFAITKFGFDQFAQTGIPEYGRICAEVARVLVCKERVSNLSVAQALSQPIRIVEHIFESLESNELIKYSTSKGGGLRMEVYWVSPELRRKLEDRPSVPISMRH
jgi:hypothetical protein